MSKRSDIADRRGQEDRDSAALAAKIASGAIGLGPVYTLIETVFGTAAGKRQRQILSQLEHDLDRLIRRFDTLDADTLSQNDIFISTAMKSVQIALRTHQQEKLEALRNAMLNAALPESPDDSVQLVFLSYVDRFTEWHLRSLRFLQDPRALVGEVDPKDYWRPIGDKGASTYTATETEYVASAFPEVEAHQDLIMQIRRDLNSCGLSKWDPFGPGTPEKFLNVFYRRKTTDFGDAFIDFISEPDLFRVCDPNRS